jgi:glycosyltransferase involved in cell wall biosynthesis
MKVCVLTATDAWGGAEIHTMALATTLAARGHDVLIHELGHRLYERPDLDVPDGLRIVPLELPKPLRDMGVRDWLRTLPPARPALSVFPKGTFEAGTWQFDVAARLSYRRYVTIEHNVSPPMPARASRWHLGGLVPGVGAWWLRLLAERYVRSLGPHRVICVSSAVQERLVTRYRFPVRKMRTVHNGISAETFRRCPEAREALRRAWGFPDDALAFGAIGRFFPQKGYDVALAAFGQLVSSMPGRDLRLVLVGEGPMREELGDTVRRAGLQDLVTFLEFTSRPWEIYSALDIYLMPSRYEGLPLALLEAMACGCCPVATAVGGIPEVLTDPSLGWLVDAGDDAGFLSAMRAVADASPDARARMGRQAREHVRSRFDALVQFGRLADLLEREWAGSARAPGRASSHPVAR